MDPNVLEREETKKQRKICFWKEKGGENSMTQSTAARILCILYSRGEVEGERGTMREL